MVQSVPWVELVKGSEFEGKSGTASPTSQQITTDDVPLLDGGIKAGESTTATTAGNGAGHLLQRKRVTWRLI